MSPKDLQKMQQQMMKAQEQMAKAQEQMAQDLAATVLDGTAGGGAVTVALTGDYHVQSVKIDPDAIDPADASGLEDLITAAFNDALDKVAAAQENAQQRMQSAALSGLKLPPGMGI
ncbi:MAG: YbaB/EbfC family nucleoid-associated protein [Ktedonobacterales bacterium]|nr:YbaB/EbfC family nucleoid-associated protein [Ktedonobacterales bacterium]